MPLIKLILIPYSLFKLSIIFLSLNIEKSKYGRNVYSITLILIPNKTWLIINEKQRINIETQDTKTVLLKNVDKQSISEHINNIGIQWTKNFRTYLVSILPFIIVEATIIIEILIKQYKIIQNNLDK